MLFLCPLPLVLTDCTGSFFSCHYLLLNLGSQMLGLHHLALLRCASELSLLQLLLEVLLVLHARLKHGLQIRLLLLTNIYSNSPGRPCCCRLHATYAANGPTARSHANGSCCRGCDQARAVNRCT